MATRPSSEQISTIANAFNQFNLLTTGTSHPGMWVVGNFSTISYCSTYGGSAKIIDSVARTLPYDYYICQTLDRNVTSYEKTAQLFDSQSILYGMVYSPSNTATLRSGVASWLYVGLVAISAVALLNSGC